jgi:RNA polymerase sigma-70 factor (ECF subfamily)
MVDDCSDVELMARIAGDDTAAFDLLFRRHQQSVFNYALRLLGEVGAAEDVTQECFLRVWKARAIYRPTAAFRTWLFTICRHVAFDVRKKQTVSTVPLATDGELDQPGSWTAQDASRTAWGDPEKMALTRELERLLEQALGRLPSDLREVVILREMEAMQYEEIAAVIGCPAGTVKSRLNAARRRLQEAAREWLGGAEG